MYVFVTDVYVCVYVCMYVCVCVCVCVCARPLSMYSVVAAIKQTSKQSNMNSFFFDKMYVHETFIMIPIQPLSILLLKTSYFDL